MRECTACHRCYEDYATYCPVDGKLLSLSLPYPLVIAGKYKIEYLIGRGGMGAVYCASQLELNRQVAIKVLRPEILASGVSPIELKNEALASARIEHINVVTIYDYGTLDNGVGYLVMRLLKGKTLTQELMRVAEVGFPFERFFGILLQLCAGVEAAHKLGIVHCDLKPDNIIIESTEDAEVVQVLDFGISRLAKTSQENLSDAFFVTPFYAAPELIANARLDFRSDIYSIGVIAYEMLTGRVPFSGDSVMEILRKHIEARPISPSKYRSDIPEGLERIVQIALAKSPDRRQQTVSELIDQLQIVARQMSSWGLLDLGLLPKVGKRTGRLQPVDMSSSVPEHPTLKIAKEEAAEEVGSFRQPLIMLVDDEPDVLVILKALLEQLGYRVVEAQSAKEALAALEQEIPDLIISDVMMPSMDGYEFYTLLRKRQGTESVPVVFLTARNIQDDKLKALTSGAEDFWIKPFDIKEIRLRVKRIIDRKLELDRLRKQSKV
ncbi:MAG: serine/threonine-protein kinase [Acidobacteriota bacterium]|nr:serine/threonine-protein kinase [Blastocatellia bacterium]MDW8413679.1 serine/threonine-protein kinase [Acidobacteriota bacterium]